VRPATSAQQPTPRERAVCGLTAGADVPTRIGPAEFSTLGVRCPHEAQAALEAAIRRTSDHG